MEEEVLVAQKPKVNKRNKSFIKVFNVVWCCGGVCCTAFLGQCLSKQNKMYSTIHTQL